MPQPALLQCCNPSAQPNLARRTPEPCCQFPIRSSNDPRLKSNELSRSATPPITAPWEAALKLRAQGSKCTHRHKAHCTLYMPVGAAPLGLRSGPGIWEADGVGLLCTYGMVRTP